MNGVYRDEDHNLIIDGRWLVTRGLNCFCVWCGDCVGDMFYPDVDSYFEIVPCLPIDLFEPLVENAHQIADIIRRAMRV